MAETDDAKTFLATCEKCGNRTELHLSDFNLELEDPFQHVCTCGNACRVTLAQPRAPRTEVKLICSFRLSADTGKVARFATVLDVSVNGMRLETDPAKNIGEGTALVATVLLDSKTKNKLELAAVVRRVVQEKPMLVLGVEFQSLTDEQRAALAPYVKT